MNIVENEQWVYKNTAVVFVPPLRPCRIVLPACHRKLVLRSSSLHRQAESCFFWLDYHKKSCEKQRGSSVCSLTQHGLCTVLLLRPLDTLLMSVVCVHCAVRPCVRLSPLCICVMSCCLRMKTSLICVPFPRLLCQHVSSRRGRRGVYVAWKLTGKLTVKTLQTQ